MDPKKSNVGSLRMPLWFILVVPSVAVIISVSTLINFLSYQNSQASINTIADQLLDEITARVELQLTNLLSVPTIINKSHDYLVRSGILDLRDLPFVQNYLWEKIQVFETVSSAYIGTPEGGLINSGREGLDGSLYLMFTEDYEAGKFYKYATDDLGNPTELQFELDSFDARTRPWYIGAVENQGAYRSEPYVLSTGQDLAIASSLPIYADDGELLGVASVDLFLSQISDYLSTLKIGETGQVYIVDSNGYLIASSQPSAFVIADETTNWQQIRADASDNTVIAATFQNLLDQVETFEDIPASTNMTVSINDEPYYLRGEHYQNSDDLDWFVVTVVPESDFLGEIQAHNRNSFLLIILASITATIIGALFSIRVTRSITKLSIVATQYATSDLSTSVRRSQIREIDDLGMALSSMAQELHETLTTLEQRVEKRTRQLAESESRYRAIVEDQTDLICRFLPDTTLTYVNPAYAQFFDSTPEELIGKKYSQFLLEEDQYEAQMHLTKINENNPISVMEHAVITASGELRWMQWIDTALYDDTGEFIEFQSVGRDITTHKKVEENLQKSLQHELELNELKTHFISTVSHEFRTPMALILNSSQFLEHYGEKIDADKKAFHLQRINQQIERMVEILEGVLIINRAERGKLQITPTSFDLKQLCQMAINEVRTVTPRKINFDLQTTGDCNKVHGDRKLIRLVVTNLISNATKYSNDGGSVWVRINCTSEHVTFVVKDNGIGMTKEVQAHIFDPFYRADQSGNVEGIGLGLSIVKQCVELHKGTIAVVSTRGQGTEFTIELPQ